MNPGAPIVPLPVVRAADLRHLVAPPRWLVERLWALNGVGVLGGAPKACKSFLALDLALSVASGTPCLDTFAVPTAGPALVYFAEDPAEVVLSRLDQLCHHRQLDLDRLPLWVLTPPSLRVDLGAEQRRIELAIQTYKPRLLVLDPFVRLHRIDENDAGQVSGVLAFLRTLQRTYDLSVLLVHHTVPARAIPETSSHADIVICSRAQRSTDRRVAAGARVQRRRPWQPSGSAVGLS